MRWMIVFLWPLLCIGESEGEALFLRRIADFWQEGEYQIAKGQMEEFIAEYPESDYCDPILAAVGDLFLREKNFSTALSYYSQIRSSEFADQVFLNRLQCLYELQWHATLTDVCEAYLAGEGSQKINATYFLALSLYQQCLAGKDPAAVQSLADRAYAHFTALEKTHLSQETAQAFAHLCCIRKDFAKASDIYLALAEKEEKEEMLFQAALIQAEYNKELALQTFDTIAKMGQKKGKEAAYNKLVLSFELGHYEELAKEDCFREIPPDRVGMAHLFLGRSYLAMKNYEGAVSEFQAYLKDAPPSDTFHAALVSLLEASFWAKDLTAFDLALAKIRVNFPQDPELAKAHFSRAQLLKEAEKFFDAQNELEQLLAKFPDCKQKAEASFELISLDYKVKDWSRCQARARAFIAEFPHHELTAFAWRHLVSCTLELKDKEQLISDLKALLQCDFLAAKEIGEWRLLLAKTYFEEKNYELAIQTIGEAKEPNALLLLALCYRDGLQDNAQFCEIAELALSQGATLLDSKQIHMALFNAYLDRDLLDKASLHLYAAFEANADLQEENLLWLARYYDLQNIFPERIVRLLEPLLPVLQTAELTCCLAKAYSQLGQTEQQVALLEQFPVDDKEGKLLLAEGYARLGKREKAIECFDKIASDSGAFRFFAPASAALQSAKLKMQLENPDKTEIATQLKNIALQKTLAHEPIYLEAALCYIDLQGSSLQKRMGLLKKMKADFESTADLLSLDYQEARKALFEKDRIYQGYMHLIDAQMYELEAELETDSRKQKELQAKAKEILLQIIEQPIHPALTERARERLEH